MASMTEQFMLARAQRQATALRGLIGHTAGIEFEVLPSASPFAAYVTVMGMSAQFGAARQINVTNHDGLTERFLEAQSDIVAEVWRLAMEPAAV